MTDAWGGAWGGAWGSAWGAVDTAAPGGLHHGSGGASNGDDVAWLRRAKQQTSRNNEIIMAMVSIVISGALDT